MIDWAAIAKSVGDVFTAASCASVGFWRPANTTNGRAGTVTDGTPVWTPVRAFILPASKGTIEAFDNRREDAALKHKQLRYVKLVAYDLAVTPRPDDQLQFEGSTWRVLGCTPVDPVGGCPLVHGVGVVEL